MVEVSHLSKNYGSHPAIRDLTFSVADGQVYGLLGPNGAGKSTIMNILTSYLAPTGGEVKVAGFSLPEQAQQAKACVGYLPEQPPLYPEMTVQEYLDFAAGYAIPICGYIGARIRPAASVRQGGAGPSARRFPPVSNACVGRRYHPPPSALQRFT